MTALLPHRLAEPTEPVGPTGPALRTEPGLATVPEVRLGLVLLVVVAALTAAHVARASPLDAVVVVGLLVAASAVVVPRRFVVVTAVTGWAWATGFVVNSGGQLTLHTADLRRLAAVVVVGLVAGALRPR